MMARLYTGCHDIVSLRNAYHGNASATMGTTAQSIWKFNVVQSGVHHAINPGPYRGVFGSDGEKYAKDVEDLIQFLHKIFVPARNILDFLDMESIVETMMQQLLSKEILHEPMKEIEERYPKWLEDNKNLGDSKLPYLVTIDPPHTAEHTLLKWTTGRSVPSLTASKALCELDQIQGKKGIWFCGAYQGYGFHEDGLKAGVASVHGMLRRNCNILNNPKQMVPTWPETGACLLVNRFLKSFIETGCIMLHLKLTRALLMHLFMRISLLSVRML